MGYWQQSNTFAHNRHLYDSYDASSESSMTPPPIISEFELFSLPICDLQFTPVKPGDLIFNYPRPLIPIDFGLPEDAPLYSARSSVVMPAPHPVAKKTHAISGRRRAQNRAAQRAFRERKERHARDLEQKLSESTVKYHSLEIFYSELNAAYRKLQKALEILTSKSEAEGGSRSAETLQKFLTTLHGEIKPKAERQKN